MKKVYEQLASLAEAYQKCIKTNNTEWEKRHFETMNQMVNDYLPSGSGIDSGCAIDHDKSGSNKLVICSSFHVMNEYGYYTGWIEFTVTVKPSLAHRFELLIKGNFGREQEVKDCLWQVFDECLMKEIR